jgi:hypothetical protein
MMYKQRINNVNQAFMQALTRAAEYDHWVRAKVQTSRADPRPAVTDDEWQRIRTAKLAERHKQVA